jgi:hypothetical protein
VSLVPCCGLRILLGFSVNCRPLISWRRPQATRPPSSLTEPEHFHQASFFLFTVSPTPTPEKQLPSVNNFKRREKHSRHSRHSRHHAHPLNTSSSIQPSVAHIHPPRAIMSSSTQSTSMSQSNSQASCHDPLDALIDFSEYDKLSYSSPSVSPSTTKIQFTGRPVSSTPASLPSSSQPDLSGPSHNYGMYRQQTGIPQGAVASTLAANQQMGAYNFSSEGYLSGIGEDYVDFGTAPSLNGSFNPSEIDMEFESPGSEPAFFYPESSSPEFVDPNAIGGNNISTSTVLPPQTSSVGRLWPGMHQQQAALAKAQAQQKQQQQIIQQQQRQNAVSSQQRQQPQRSRASHQPTDPIVEEKISQLLNSMRQNSVGSDEDGHTSNAQMNHVQRMRKEEEDMDEDERLLASEEGKKLSSKERRQLRNKVSARAFRSRRKGKHR